MNLHKCEICSWAALRSVFFHVWVWERMRRYVTVVSCGFCCGGISAFNTAKWRYLLNDYATAANIQIASVLACAKLPNGRQTARIEKVWENDTTLLSLDRNVALAFHQLESVLTGVDRNDRKHIRSNISYSINHKTNKLWTIISLKRKCHG